jgi:hypothetical protein
VNWPLGLSEDIRAHIQREKESFLLDGKEFRRRVVSVLDEAHIDAGKLEYSQEASVGSVNIVTTLTS